MRLNGIPTSKRKDVEVERSDDILCGFRKLNNNNKATNFNLNP